MQLADEISKDNFNEISEALTYAFVRTAVRERYMTQSKRPGLLIGTATPAVYPGHVGPSTGTGGKCGKVTANCPQPLRSAYSMRSLKERTTT